MSSDVKPRGCREGGRSLIELRSFEGHHSPTAGSLGFFAQISSGVVGAAFRDFSGDSVPEGSEDHLGSLDIAPAERLSLGFSDTSLIAVGAICQALETSPKQEHYHAT